MIVKQASVDDAISLSRYYLDNADHLSHWERKVEDGFHDIGEWETRLKLREKEQAEGRSVYFLAYNEQPGEIIATCSLSGITQGAFMACYMGYSVSKKCEGQGYMKKLCMHAIDYAFQQLGLNRVMANYMPANTRSANLLQGLGFVKEGFAKKYLFINGQWEDHVMTALVNPANL